MKNKVLFTIVGIFIISLIGLSLGIREETRILEDNTSIINDKAIFETIIWSDTNHELIGYNGEFCLKDNSKNGSDILKIDNKTGKLKEGNLPLNSGYYQYKQKSQDEYLFYKDEYYSMKTGELKKIISEDFKKKNKLLVNQNNDINENLDFVIGNKEYLIYIMDSADKIQMVIFDSIEKQYYISDILDKKKFNFSNGLKIYYEKTSKSIYGIRNNGEIDKFILSNGKITLVPHSKLALDYYVYVRNTISSGENIYFEIVDESNVFYSSQIRIYDTNKNISKAIFTYTGDNSLRIYDYMKGYVLLEEVETKNNIKKYNRYLAKLDNEELKILSALPRNNTSGGNSAVIKFYDEQGIFVMKEVLRKMYENYECRYSIYNLKNGGIYGGE